MTTTVMLMKMIIRYASMFISTHNTRKLSYRKDDRAMRPMYGCLEKFRESLTTPMATFLEIFNGHLFRLSLLMCMQNLKFVALPVPGIRGTPKNGQSLPGPWIRPRSLFSKIFNGLLFGWPF